MNEIRASTLPHIALCALALAVAPLAAQPADVEPLRLAQAISGAARQVVFGDEDTLAFAAGELGDERIAKGAPYCAEAVHETVQWLPDAAGGVPNRIVRKQATQLCRDGEGRTRQEVERNGRTLVYLRDPVARESWVLDAQRKTARRLSGTRTLIGGAGEIDRTAWREYGERMRQWASEMARSMSSRSTSPQAVPPAPPAPPVPAAAGGGTPAPVIVQRGDGEHGVRVLRLDAGAMPPLPPLPAVSWRAHALAPRGTGVVTALPAKDVEGVRANGERTTWTIEAGKIGNERPIQIVREVWTSPELLLTLSTRDFDPRSGEVNYRLQNLRRGEPDAALMRVPADYTTQRRDAPRTPAAPASRG